MSIAAVLQPFGPRLDPFYKEIRYRLNIPTSHATVSTSWSVGA
ncbi:MAG TPA: hypothetical protein VLL08_25850 [Kineosporiaceae bacterium]|nr:hypothetical protein [Kineosporiaceae bacterium]